MIAGPSTEAGASFGAAVAAGDVDGDGFDDIVIGAPGENTPAGENAGTVRVYSGATRALLFQIESPQGATYGYFGSAVAVGDVDGDGWDDIVSGAPYEQGADGSIAGHVYVFSGRGAVLMLSLTVPEAGPFALFGYAVAAADVTGDGRADVIATAPGQDVAGIADEGRAYVFSGVDGSLARVIESPTQQPFADFGTSLATGDMNADGIADIAVGAPWETEGEEYGRGRAYVFSGGNGSVLQSLGSPEPEAMARFGAAVAMGDVDGDGSAEIAVSAPYASSAFAGAPHRVYVFSQTGPEAGLQAPFVDPSDRFGKSLLMADTDGDGHSEVIAAAPGSGPARLDVYAGGSFAESATSGGSDFGASLAAGDIDGDGAADVIVGSPAENRVHLLFGRTDDGDGISDADDNCPRASNSDQADADGDGAGDVCDPDRDGDGVPNVSDGCAASPEDFDAFHDADGCPDPDNDGDGIADITDQCPGTDATAGPDGIADTGDEPLTPFGVPIQTKEDYDGI